MNKCLEFEFFNSIQNSHVHEPSKLVENLQHLHAYYHREKRNLKSLSKLKSLGFSVLKYIVLTFCWHSIEASAAFAARCGCKTYYTCYSNASLAMKPGSCIILLWSNLNWNRCITVTWECRHSFQSKKLQKDIHL